ncbi:MAG: MFS transporter [archaeon]|nr:MFS transporter [archaeon]
MKSSSDGTFVPGRLSMVALLTSSMLILMGGAAVAPGIPGIAAHFPGNDDLVPFVITLPHLAVAVTGFLMGVIADRFGKVRTLVASLLIFLITGAGSFFLDNIYLILVLRFLLGFGLAGIVTSVTALIGGYYQGMSRVRMLGYQSAAMGIGVLILELVGGILSDMGWNYPFIVYLIAVPILAIVLISLREPSVREDVSGDGVVDRKTDNGMLAVCYVSIFIGMLVLFVIPTKMPSYMEGSMGVSATLMGLYLGFHGISNAASSCMHRRLVQVLAPIQLIMVAFALLAIALMLPSVLGGSVPVCIVTLVVSGIAVGQLVPSIVGSVVNASSPANSGKMMGIYAVCLNTGQFAVALVTIPLFGLAGESYPVMFTMFAALAVVMFVALLCVYLARKKGQASA